MSSRCKCTKSVYWLWSGRTKCGRRLEGGEGELCWRVIAVGLAGCGGEGGGGTSAFCSCQQRFRVSPSVGRAVQSRCPSWLPAHAIRDRCAIGGLRGRRGSPHLAVVLSMAPLLCLAQGVPDRRSDFQSCAGVRWSCWKSS